MVLREEEEGRGGIGEGRMNGVEGGGRGERRNWGGEDEWG